MEINFDDAEVLIQIQGVYDGWSVAKMKDGRLLNRWQPGTRRYEATESWIAMQEGA